MTPAISGHAAIEALVPHKGAMCLWDTVEAWDDARIVLATDGHRDPAHPLRRDGRLGAVHLCEYGAQAMAVHGGLRGAAAGGAARVDFLVALRDVQLHVARLDDLPGALRAEATLLAESAASQQYAFTVRHGDTVLAEGRAAVMLRD